MRRRGTTTFFTCLLAITLRGFAQAGGTLDDHTALLVNGQPVSADEFKFFLEQETAGVIQSVRTQYHLDYGRGFWTHDCNGTTPAAILQSNTVARIVREKIELLEFQKLGLVPDVSYAAFLADWEKTNQERAQAVQQGRPVYGPVQYSELQFHERRHAALQIQARDKLAEQHQWADAEKVRSFYDASRERYKKPATSTFDFVTVQPAGAAAETNTTLPSSVAEEILAKMEAGADPNQVVMDYAARTELQVTCRRIAGMDASRISEIFPDSVIVRRLMELSAGKSRSETVSLDRIVLVKCVEKIPGASIPYEQIKDRVTAQYIEKCYAEFLDELVHKAQVEPNQKLLDRLVSQSENL